MTIAGHAVRADDLWIVAIAALCGVSCGTLGCFLVLRRMAMLGDAISHAVLPGIAVGFLLSGTRNLVPMLIGAGATGILTAFATAALERHGRVAADAALGVVFSVLFALGVLLVTWSAASVDLDPGCVLYGLLEFAPFDTVTVAGLAVPRTFVGLAAITILDLALLAVFWKELKLVSFDAAFATAAGFSASLIHYAFIALVAATTVASFEAVGSILVVAMLIGPGATAHLLTDRLHRMVAISAAVVIAAAVLGYVLAVVWNTSVAGMVSVVLGAQFALAALLAPRHGIVVRRLRQAQLSARIAREDLLAALWRWHEERGETAMPAAAVSAVGRGLGASLGRRWLGWRGSVVRRDDGWALSERGLREGAAIVRAHRLWEGYFASRLGLPEDHLHDPAHRVEHFVDEAMEARLAEELGIEADPHGKRIP
jgi:manganese/zinc/iron transport system permease protein